LINKILSVSLPSISNTISIITFYDKSPMDENIIYGDANIVLPLAKSGVTDRFLDVMKKVFPDNKPNLIDEYIKQFPIDGRGLIRALIFTFPGRLYTIVNERNSMKILVDYEDGSYDKASYRYEEVI